MKKLFALLLAVVMVISMAACAPADEDPTTTAPATTTAATTTAATTTEAEPFDPYDLTGIVADNKINIGIFTDATVLDYEDNYLTNYLEELTGLEIEFTFFSKDDTEKQQQLTLMIANKEQLPDILMNVATGSMIDEMGQNGLLVDTTDFLENESYFWKALVDTMNDFEKSYMYARSVDPITGEMYFVPGPYVNVGGDSQQYMTAISKTMAENVGMKAEEIDTVDELYQFLYKTTKEDGNGNGTADEIGLFFRQDGWMANAELWIINAYIYCNDSNLYNVEDGEVYLPYNTDEYRQAMITLNKWYSEGLISPLSYSVDNWNDMKAIIDAGAGNYKAPAWGGHSTVVVNADSTIGLDYTYGRTLADETGKGGYGTTTDPYSLYKSITIPTNEKEPERETLGLRFADILCDKETQFRMRYGEPGVNWDYLDGEAENAKTLHGNWADMVLIADEWAKETKATWHFGNFAMNTSGSVEAGLSRAGTEFAEITPESRNNIAYGCLWDKQAAGMPDEVVYSLEYNAEENEVKSEYQKLYKEFVLQSRAQMVAGVIDPNDDAQWQKYLDELKLNGEDELVEAAQSAYDRMNG